MKSIQEFFQSLYNHIHPLTAGLLVLVILLLAMIAWSAYFSHVTVNSNPPTPTLTSLPNEATPLPIEWQENAHQTNGIVLGGVILVLIVVGGTLSTILRRQVPRTR